MAKNLKFGLMYQKVGQTTEKELFDNHGHSEAMERFMAMLGTKVELSRHRGYSGNLGSGNQLCGQWSLYTKHRDSEIMFHVSTLLPHSNTDKHQIQVTTDNTFRVYLLFEDKNL